MPLVLVEKQSSKVTILALNRPERRNALTIDLMSELTSAVESVAEIYGAPPVIFPLDPASGPVGAVCGVQQPATPVVSFGISYAGSNPHAPDENIRLEDFVAGIKYFGRIIHRLAHDVDEEDANSQREAPAPISK